MVTWINILKASQEIKHDHLQHIKYIDIFVTFIGIFNFP